MHFMHTARTWMLALSILLGFSSFGLLLHLMVADFGFNPSEFTPEFEVLGLLAGGLGVLLWPVILILPIYRRNVLFLNVIFEVTIMVVFSILWATCTALLILWRNDADLWHCGRFGGDFAEYCRETFAVQGLIIALLATSIFYLATLLVFAIISHTNGRPVWKDCITDLGSFDKRFPQFIMETHHQLQTQVWLPSDKGTIPATATPTTLNLKLPPQFYMGIFPDSQETKVGASPYLNDYAKASGSSVPSHPGATAPTSLYPVTPNLPQV
ncbi:hypothetical protein BJ165DRAFT_560854 [Panaeolus papilionaceus]|nr:hypothetical protein BJ165DRAFT_560854 [Panaeolus papilionaceus]